MTEYYFDVETLGTNPQQDKIVGATCPKCNKTRLPPRMYCEACFSELKDWVDVGKEGRVDTFTAAQVGVDGEPFGRTSCVWSHKISKSEGIIHIVHAKPEKVKIGMRVKAKLNPKKDRTGSILDIGNFVPL